MEAPGSAGEGSRKNMEFQDSFVFWLLVIVVLMGIGAAGAFSLRRIIEKILGR